MKQLFPHREVSVEVPRWEGAWVRQTLKEGQWGQRQAVPGRGSQVRLCEEGSHMALSVIKEHSLYAVRKQNVQKGVRLGKGISKSSLL